MITISSDLSTCEEWLNFTSTGTLDTGESISDIFSSSNFSF